MTYMNRRNQSKNVGQNDTTGETSNAEENREGVEPSEPLAAENDWRPNLKPGETQPWKGWTFRQRH